MEHRLIYEKRRRRRRTRELPGGGAVEVNTDGLQQAESALEAMRKEVQVEGKTREQLAMQKDQMEVFVAEMQMKVWFDQHAAQFLGTNELPADYRFEVRTEEQFRAGYKTGNLAVIIEFWRGETMDSVTLLPDPDLELGGSNFNHQKQRYVDQGGRDLSLVTFTKEGFDEALSEEGGVIENWLITTSEELAAE